MNRIKNMDFYVYLDMDKENFPNVYNNAQWWAPLL